MKNAEKMHVRYHTDKELDDKSRMSAMREKNVEYRG